MIAVVGGSGTFSGPTQAEYEQQGNAQLSQSMQNLAQNLRVDRAYKETKFQNDFKNSWDTLAKLAADAGKSMNNYLKSTEGKNAAMRFAPTLYRQAEESKIYGDGEGILKNTWQAFKSLFVDDSDETQQNQALDFLNSMAAAPSSAENQQAHATDLKAGGDIALMTETRPGEPVDYRQFLPQPPAPPPTPPTPTPTPQPGIDPRLNYSKATGSGDVLTRPGPSAFEATTMTANRNTAAPVMPQMPFVNPQDQGDAAAKASAGVSAFGPTAAMQSRAVSPPPASGPGPVQAAPTQQMSFHEYVQRKIIADNGKHPDWAKDYNKDWSDAELAARWHKTREEYARQFGIDPVTKNPFNGGPMPVARGTTTTTPAPASTLPASAPPATTADIKTTYPAGADAVEARKIGLTDEEISALQAYDSAGKDYYLLDRKTLGLANRAFDRIKTASQKEIRRWTPTKKGSDEFGAYAQEAADFANRFAEDSPLKNDPDLSDLFMNGATIKMDREVAETAKIWQEINNFDALAGIQKTNAAAALLNAQSKAFELKSEGYKNIVDAASKRLDSMEAPIKDILGKSKNPKEFADNFKLLHSELLKDPGYKAYADLYATNLGKLGDQMGVNPIINLIYGKGWFGSVNSQGMVETYVPASGVPSGGQALTEDAITAGAADLSNRIK